MRPLLPPAPLPSGPHVGTGDEDGPAGPRPAAKPGLGWLQGGRGGSAHPSWADGGRTPGHPSACYSGATHGTVPNGDAAASLSVWKTQLLRPSSGTWKGPPQPPAEGVWLQADLPGRDLSVTVREP